MSAEAEEGFGSSTTAQLPSPYCEGPWKQWIIGLAMVSGLTLAFAIEEHFRRAYQAPVAAASTATVAPPAANDVMPVAATQPLTARAWTDGVDPNLQLVAGKPRTAFNASAESIRPSVVGVRAALEPRQPGLPSLERIGSGVVVDATGYVVTCNHVVAGAANIVVNRFLEPNIQLPARALAVEDDLALLKIQTDAPIAAARLADSNQVQVGDWVLAVGHPFGLGLTVTSGIVGRRHGVLSIPGGPQYTELLQTDAPINEGSSGGPLVNLAGEVIGLNTAIYAPTGVFSGAGFAVPSNRVRQFLARHVPEFGAAASAPSSLWGISVGDLTSTERAQFPTGGVVVLAVEPGSPAAAQAVAAGDVITGIASRPVPDTNALRQLQVQSSASAPIQVRVWRSGQARDLTFNAPINSTQG